MSFHPHMTAPGSGFGHMKFMKDMKGMMNMMEQLKKHNKDGEVLRAPEEVGRHLLVLLVHHLRVSLLRELGPEDGAVGVREHAVPRWEGGWSV